MTRPERRRSASTSAAPALPAGAPFHLRVSLVASRAVAAVWLMVMLGAFSYAGITTLYLLYAPLSSEFQSSDAFKLVALIAGLLVAAVVCVFAAKISFYPPGSRRSRWVVLIINAASTAFLFGYGLTIIALVVGAVVLLAIPFLFASPAAESEQ